MNHIYTTQELEYLKFVWTEQAEERLVDERRRAAQRRIKGKKEKNMKEIEAELEDFFGKWK